MTEDYNPTEWLANCSSGYGWGRTQSDALYNMLANMDPVSDRKDDVTVTFVEHRGSARVGPGGFDVEEFVSGEYVTYDADRLRDLRVDALDLSVALDRFEDEPEDVEKIEPAGER